jgi:hypothetical protein
MKRFRPGKRRRPRRSNEFLKRLARELERSAVPPSVISEAASAWRTLLARRRP